jgi:(p)ppGpp synthase/HD superfamily hydrolase
MSVIEKARLFALKAHGDQKYGEHPYIYHLESVAAVLIEHEMGVGGDHEAVYVASWLHDVIEDTDTTFEQVFEEFGRVVARIVFACSDEPGKNRRERHERTYPKLKAAGREAIAVKLADRIANVRHSAQHNHGMLKMYQREYAEFKKALHLPGELKSLWASLDCLMLHEVELPKE